MYVEEKAAQTAAILLSKAPGQRLERIRLMKLLYLADRSAFEQLGRTITGDRLVSMDQGPVLSKTLTGLQQDEFPNWVVREGLYSHCLAEGANINNARLLSTAELAVIDAVWVQFGSMSKWELVTYTHDTCTEWQDPHGSMIPISLRDLGEAVGFSEVEISALLEEQREHDSLVEAIASL